MKIKDVLQAKASGEVITIEPDATVRDLLRILAEHNVAGLHRAGIGRCRGRAGP